MSDRLTALLRTLGHGLRVDLGECPACIGDRLEWMNGTSPPVGCERDANGWDWNEWRRRYERPCQACTVDGTPTGRESIDWATALAQAMQSSRPLSNINAKHGRGECSGCGHLAALTKGGLVRSHTGPGPGPRCSGTGKRPSASIREALAVLADKLQAAGDTIGEWLAAWLAGPCPTCRGVAPAPVFVSAVGHHGPSDTVFLHPESGHYSAAPSEGAIRVPRARWVESGAGEHARIAIDCDKCHGHGTLLGWHGPDMVEHAIAHALPERWPGCEVSSPGIYSLEFWRDGKVIAAFMTESVEQTLVEALDRE